jgi:hypothetical protein
MKPKRGLTGSTATADPADHREALLDEALQETFPASDPIAVSLAGTGPAGARTKPRSARSGHAVAKTRKNRAGSTHHRAGTWTWPKSPNK